MIRTQKPKQPYKETTNIKQTEANETKAWFRGILHQLAISKRLLHTIIGMGWNDISVPYQHVTPNSTGFTTSVATKFQTVYRRIHDLPIDELGLFQF